MSFNNTDSPFDIDESLRTGELIHPEARMGMLVTWKDIFMNDGQMEILMGDNQIKGESNMHENAEWIDAYGYFFAGYRPQGASARLYRSLTIVKRTDIATPSLFNRMQYSRSKEAENKPAELAVRLHILRHDEWTATPQGMARVEHYNPHTGNIWLTIKLTGARITNISTLTSTDLPFPMDVVSLAFDKCNIRVQSLSWLETLTSRERLKGGAARPPRYNEYEIDLSAKKAEATPDKKTKSDKKSKQDKKPKPDEKPKVALL